MKSIYEYRSQPESLYGWGMDDDVPRIALENIKKHGPTPRREQAVAKNADTAIEYAKNFIKGPWPPGEAAIATSDEYSTLYKEFVVSKTKPKTT